MPTPPLSPELGAEAVRLIEEYGNPTLASRASGIPRQTLVGRARSYRLDPAIQASMAAVGTDMVPSLAWAKVPAKDGEPGYSVLLKPQETSDDTLDRIRRAFEGMTPAELVAAPDAVLDDLCTVYPIADAHIGLRAWQKETGESYDTDIAARRVKDWVARCVSSSPASATAIILDVGDLLHADDNSNQTPKSKHPLDVDSRMFRTLDVSIAAMGAAVESALLKHRRVIVRILRGNHNETSYLAVLFALAERYRNEPRVEVQKDPREIFIHEFGKVLIGAYHGDRAKADRMVLFLADEYAEAWGRTKHRFLFSGHLHHHKSQDIGGVKWEQLRAVTARDAYAVSHAYSARAQLQAITYHRSDGEVQRVSVNG